MKNLILVRGGEDLATGTIYKLRKSGFPVLILETAAPSAIRRNVAFCEAVYQGTQTVEDMTCCLAESSDQAQRFLKEGKLTVLVDPAGESIQKLQPLAVVDAILAKKNLGTTRTMAPITVALGPGFTAGADVDAVVEILDGKIETPDNPSCGFSEDISITIGGNTFALACDRCGIVKNCTTGKYISISDAERDILEKLFTGRGGKFPCV